MGVNSLESWVSRLLGAYVGNSRMFRLIGFNIYAHQLSQKMGHEFIEMDIITGIVINDFISIIEYHCIIFDLFESHKNAVT